jgi:geranylgeranyl pyrophosphate synthase
MPDTQLHRQLGLERQAVEKELRRLFRKRAGVPLRLHQAMRHSLLGGGKRLRPIILLWTWDAVSLRRRSGVAPRQDALLAACALEMLHTYSLIHDDLPAMDDDVLRRGRPTCHVAFDEATAILAGDGLQALAFETLARAGRARAGELVAMAAAAVGPAGMVGGQQEDLDSEGRRITATGVRGIHLKKTAALLGAAFGCGALLGGGDRETVQQVVRAGQDLGLAFQGADDLLDVTGEAASLGKTAGKDEAAEKATWVRLEGLEKARRRTEKLGQRGLRGLQAALPAGPARERLVDLGSMMWNRDR